ncbi:MAG TPA: signal recognition particle protein, partial [Flavisolibacter sp.]|nr:signal recognition particle protein [Flavisolibacter sp.]
EIRRALVDADVNYKIAKEFTDRVKDKATGEKVINAISPGQLMVKIVKDELVELMGNEAADFNAKGAPAVILIAGLQGSGKTTFSAKLANYLKKQKKLSPFLVAADVYRPAAMEQLRVLGEQIGIDVHLELENKNPVEIAQNAIREARAKNKNVVIIDTAGRLAIDEAMMTEVANIKSAVNPQEVLFVVDSMTGQDAVNTAKAFNDRLNFSGVVLTKLDGDTRGGAALSIKYTVDKPIKFISSGEKMDTLDVFYPERMAQRILGMGDITTLVEKAQAQFDEEQARKLEKKIRKNQFDFADFKQQLEQIKRMGNLKDLMAMIPGVGKAMKDIDISDDAFKGVEAIINSMTPFERANPDEIDGGRRKRIAKGSGKDISEVNAFMKQFEQMREMMKMMNKMPMGKMMPGMKR